MEKVYTYRSKTNATLFVLFTLGALAVPVLIIATVGPANIFRNVEVLAFLAVFFLAMMIHPVMDISRWRHSRIVLLGSTISQYDRLGRKRGELTLAKDCTVSRRNVSEDGPLRYTVQSPQGKVTFEDDISELSDLVGEIRRFTAEEKEMGF